MDSATVPTGKQLLMWVVWGIVVLVSLLGASRATVTFTEPPASVLVVNTKREDTWKLFPWLPRWRWKKSALREYRMWKERYRRAPWNAYSTGQARRNARMAQLLLQGAVPLAQIVKLTLRQVHYQLGALSVLYALLETLQVRQIINRHCPTRREVDHGTIALVLVLNRLMFPLPIYRVADWVGRMVLESMLGIDASKFNDDRIGRTLDALAPHLEAIWLEVSAVAP